MGKRSRTAPLISQEAETTTDLVVLPSQPKESDAAMTQEASSSKKKKAKKHVEEPEKEEKPPRQKAPGQKLFSNDDVVLLMEASDKLDAGADFVTVYDSLKLSMGFTKEQVKEKLSRLRQHRKNSKRHSTVQLSIEDLDFEAEMVKKVSGLGGLPESLLTQVLESMDQEQRAELNSRWVKLKFAEAELVTEKTMLFGDFTTLVSNAFKQF